MRIILRIPKTSESPKSDEAPARLDQLLLSELRKRFPSLSRASLKKAFQEKRVLFRGNPIKASAELGPGEHEFEIKGEEAEFSAAAPASASRQGSFLPILYEDERILVLNKATGVPSVPHASNETETAVGAALAHLPGLSRIGTRPLEPAIIHRLDTGTSGALVFAKTAEEYDHLRAIWSSGQVRKTYRALVTPKTPTSRFPTLPLELRPLLAHDAHSAKRMMVVKNDESDRPKHAYRGKPLPTITRLIALHTGDKKTSAVLDVEVQIQTGVMHQIRCTLAHLGFPILGDSIYRGQEASRLFLHAWKVEIPSSEPRGNSLLIEAPLPKEWILP